MSTVTHQCCNQLGDTFSTSSHQMHKAASVVSMAMREQPKSAATALHAGSAWGWAPHTELSCLNINGRGSLFLNSSQYVCCTLHPVLLIFILKQEKENHYFLVFRGLIHEKQKLMLGPFTRKQPTVTANITSILTICTFLSVNEWTNNKFLKVKGLEEFIQSLDMNNYKV